MKFLHDGMDHPVSQWCRIYQLEEIRIKAGKSPDELVERIQGLADRCDFPTQVEKEWHIQFRLVHALSDRELVKKLLTMKIKATTAEMLATCCTHIAISDNMSSMGLTTSTVNAVQKFQKKSQCGNCTKPHGPGRQHCPVRNSTCSFCHKQGHWVAKCRKAKKSKPGTKRPHNPPQQPGHWKGGRKKTAEVGVSEGDPHCDEITIHAWLANQKKKPKDPKEITFADISIDAMMEAFANVEMPVASKKRASLQYKVDTSAGGNVMPFEPLENSSLIS